MSLIADSGGCSVPKALEKKLRRKAKAKGLTGKRANAYVYGSLRRTGWRPKRRK